MDTTNLRQIEGGTVIKQADRSSVLSFILQDAKWREVKLDGQTAQVALYTNQGKYWETSTTVKGTEVSFSLPGNLAVDDYLLDISVAGYVFPSDRDLIIRVTQGFKNLPDKETAERSERTLEEITEDVQKQADEKLKQNITIITKKKDQALKEIDSKAKNIADTVKTDVSGLLKDYAKQEDMKISIDTLGAGLAAEIDRVGLNLKDKVDKEPGKGLSDNNFTNSYKAKLDSLDTDIDKKLHDKFFPPIVMTAVIDQENSNPLTCITYEDDAKMMEKGSPEWDKFFQSQLVLFKDGKEVRELEDSELNDLKPEDGDVMVRFPRKGLRIKTVGEKVYVSMTNAPNNSNFKYYAHSRGGNPRNAFYLGAYLGFEESGKLRSITGKDPTENKTIGDFRTIAQANGAGYEQLAFYQWTFLQAMYVLKYGNLDSQTALGKGNTSASNYDKATGETNGKGIDFGSTDDKTKVRFQWIEDFFGTKYQWCDGWKSGGSSNVLTATDNFNNDGEEYSSHDIGFSGNIYGQITKVQGTTELGFLIKAANGSETTYYCDYENIYGNQQNVAFVGGYAGRGAGAGAFCLDANDSAYGSYSTVGARLMFL